MLQVYKGLWRGTVVAVSTDDDAPCHHSAVEALRCSALSAAQKKLLLVQKIADNLQSAACGCSIAH